MMDDGGWPVDLDDAPGGSQRPSGSGGGSFHKRAVLAATILGSSVAFIDGSVVNVALPSLAVGLDAGGFALAWTISAYLLPLGALTLLGGALGDSYGRRRVFLCGLSVFTAASILCGLAPSIGWLLVGRAAQGIGAAVLLPNSLALLGSSFEGAARGRAIGSWAAAGALLSAVGPLMGGWLVDNAGWRAIFFINVPVAAPAFILMLRFVEEQETPGKRGLDWPGGLLATLSLLAVTLALSLASEPASSLPVVAFTAALGCVLLVVFTVVENRKGEASLIPISLLTSRPFVGLSFLTLFLYAALGGLVVLLPYFLIEIGRYSGVAAGAAMLPLPLAIGLGSPLAGRLSARFGPRRLLGTGSIAVALGFAGFQRVAAGDIDYVVAILPAMFVISLGMMLCVAPLTTAVIETVDTEHIGAASGLNSAIARIGSLLATAALGFAFAQLGNAESFLTAFHTAAWCGTILAVAAAASILLSAPKAPGAGLPP
jgi:EmrB/QacA subfamily drug resistance transporter